MCQSHQGMSSRRWRQGVNGPACPTRDGFSRDARNTTRVDRVSLEPQALTVLAVATPT